MHHSEFKWCVVLLLMHATDSTPDNTTRPMPDVYFVIQKTGRICDNPSKHRFVDGGSHPLQTHPTQGVWRHAPSNSRTTRTVMFWRRTSPTQYLWRLSVPQHIYLECLVAFYWTGQWFAHVPMQTFKFVFAINVNALGVLQRALRFFHWNNATPDILNLQLPFSYKTVGGCSQSWRRINQRYSIHIRLAMFRVHATARL